jgi:hypothetical protein
MDDWKPEKESTVGDADGDEESLSRKLYLWIVPPRGRK